MKVERDQYLWTGFSKKIFKFVLGVGYKLCTEVQFPAEVVFRGQDAAELLDARQNGHAVHANSVAHEVQQANRNLPQVRVLDLHLEVALARPQQVAGMLGAELAQLGAVRMLADFQHFLYRGKNARCQILHVVAGIHVALPAVHDAIVVVLAGHKVLRLQAVAGDVAVQGVRLLGGARARIHGALVYVSAQRASGDVKIDLLPLALVVVEAPIDQGKRLPQPFPRRNVVRWRGPWCPRSTAFLVAVKNKY